MSITIHPLRVKSEYKINKSSVTFFDVRGLSLESEPRQVLRDNALYAKLEIKDKVYSGPCTTLLSQFDEDEINECATAYGLDLTAPVKVSDEVQSSVKDFILTKISEDQLKEIPSCSESQFFSKEALPKNLITFSIAGLMYQAEPGMTWEQWIESEYNHHLWYWGSNYDTSDNKYQENETYITLYIHQWINYVIFKQDSGEDVIYSETKDDLIIPNYDYQLRSQYGDEINFYDTKLITFYIQDYMYYAEEGMNWYEWCDSMYNTSEGAAVDGDRYLGCDFKLSCGLDSSPMSDTYNGQWCISAGFVSISAVVGRDLITPGGSYYMN